MILAKKADGRFPMFSQKNKNFTELSAKEWEGKFSFKKQKIKEHPVFMQE